MRPHPPDLVPQLVRQVLAVHQRPPRQLQMLSIALRLQKPRSVDFEARHLPLRNARLLRQFLGLLPLLPRGEVPGGRPDRRLQPILVKWAVSTP